MSPLSPLECSSTPLDVEFVTLRVFYSLSPRKLCPPIVVFSSAWSNKNVTPLWHRKQLENKIQHLATNRGIKVIWKVPEELSFRNLSNKWWRRGSYSTVGRCRAGACLKQRDITAASIFHLTLRDGTDNSVVIKAYLEARICCARRRVTRNKKLQANFSVISLHTPKDALWWSSLVSPLTPR